MQKSHPLQRFFLQRHFKATVGLLSFTIGLGLAFFFTPFTFLHACSAISLTFIPTYLIAKRYKKPFDKKDIWQGILAAEAASYAPSPSLDEDNKIAATWR
jgi:hypothetical protein